MSWRKDPTKFVIEAIGATPDRWQSETLQLLADHDKVSVRSCHGPGKSTLDSWAILWFMSCFFPAKVPCAAPTLHQLKDILWSELAIWHKQMLPALKDEFVIRASDQDMRLYLKNAPQESFAVARTGRKENPEALQGFHSENLLFIIDEASGVDDVVFEVAQGALSSAHAKVLMTSNPTRVSGYFYDSHHKMRDRWKTVKIGADDSPRVTDQYKDDIALQYGKDSNIYRVRVQGEFPKSDDDTLIPLDIVESAIGREIRVSRETDIVWGLDVARFGNDRTVLLKRRGPVVNEKERVWQGQDTMVTAGKVVDEYEKALVKPIVINVDVIGIGSGVVDRLKELGLPVQGINVGETPSANDRYSKLRDELWFKAREWFEGRDVSITEDQEALVGELTTPKYTVLSTGKLKVESKDDMKKRGVRSPDIADAFCLTFAKPVTHFFNKPLKLDTSHII